jgi:SNF2 family DNA or RNA helicase
MVLELWDHQQDMSDWFRQRQAGMLAADMGTGKSGAAIDAVRECDKVLICCPVAVGPAWEKQYGLFDPDRNLLQLTQYSVKKRAELIRACVSKRMAVVLNYEVVWMEAMAKTLMETQWDAIVLDESHRIKSANGRASRWLANLAARHPRAKRLCLTGTPMPHSPLDLFGQFRFLDPRIFGSSFVRMRGRYADTDPIFPSKVRRWKNQTELAAKLDANSWRVTADEVLDLPDAIHETLPVQLSPKTLRAYLELEQHCVAELEKGQVVVGNALTKLLRLGQMTGGYAPIPRADGTQQLTLVDGMPAKASMLEEWMSDLPVNEPVVVFCRFAADVAEVHAVCRRLGRTSSELSGGRSGHPGLKEWQDGQTTVIAVQIASGGVGIDLTRAAYAVYYSMTWSLGDYEQSLARLRRPGQKRCCRYYHLVAKGTVDEDIYKALSERKDVVESVVTRLTKRIPAK